MGFKKLDYKRIECFRFKENDDVYTGSLISTYKLVLLETYDVITEEEKTLFLELLCSHNRQSSFFNYLEQEGIEAVVVESLLSFRDFRECIGVIDMFSSNKFPLIFAKEGIDTSRKQDIGVFTSYFKRLFFASKIFTLSDIKDELEEATDKVFRLYDIYR